MKSMTENNQEISIRVQEKFEFYLLSLTFVILGLSIQTASFGSSMVSDGFELAAWILLLVSGLIGLSRMEWFPQLYKLAHEIEIKEQYGEKAKLRKMRGETQILEEDRKQQPIEDSVNKLKDLEEKNKLKYRRYRITFKLGIISLICGRGYSPLAEIIANFNKQKRYKNWVKFDGQSCGLPRLTQNVMCMKR